MNKHTPGPWRYTDGGIIDNTPLRGHAGIEIADVYGADIHDDKEPETGEAQANAQLIAAAPDLLEAAKGLVDAIERNCDADKVAPRLGFMRAAIVKAEEIRVYTCRNRKS